MKKLKKIILCLIIILSLLPAEALAITDSELRDLEKYFRTADVNVEYNLLIGDDALVAGESDLLIVMVYNRGGHYLNDATIELELPAGISIAEGAARQVVGRLKSNGVAYAEFPIIVDRTIEGQSAKIGALISGWYSNWIPTGQVDEDGDPIEREERVPDKFTEYFYVPIKGGKGGSAENPILLLTNYSCGGTVIAGSNFGLNLTLLNTSQVDLHNIKVTVAGAAFVPVGSSNSFYVESIPAGETINKTITMSCPRETPQGAQSITVSSTFNEGSSSDTISVPVTQQTRLVIDDILDPGWLTMADMGYLNISYRNMGNNQINNLTITVEGDFDIDGSPVYYVGNMANGRQDSYSVNFYPRQEGECNGKVIFTYEDADGKAQSIEKTFSLNIGPAPVWDDMPIDDMPIEEPGMPLWGWIAIGAGALAAVIVTIVVLKKRKAKKQGDLDLDE